MPELPEAETIVRGLRDPLRGRTVVAVEVLRPDLLSDPPRDFRQRLTGKIFQGVVRRGKNLVLELGGTTSEAKYLVVNLGMSGRLLLQGPDSEARPSHPGVRMRLDDGSTLVYHDIRRFGRLQLLPPNAFHRWTESLGPEPLGPRFTVERLTTDLCRSAAPIRSWLLDQRKVAGIGNIYANEALFLAGIDPRTPAREIAPAGVRRLHGAIQSVLREAIRARGTTLRDYRTAQGWEGSYAAQLRVYGREGEPCRTCGMSIERIVFGGRSAFICPGCQACQGHA